MPELPEVETTRRGISPHLLGRRVTQVLVRQDQLRWPVSPDLGQSLTGQTIQTVDRRAKYLLIGTERGRMMIHLGMSGSLRVLPKETSPGRHDHVDVVLDDAFALRLRDPRRFGSIFWLPGDESHSLLDELGPEPLSEAFSAGYLHTRARGRRTPVKTLLMNGQVVVGVGNIYANEALFQAGIRPDRLAGKVSLTRYARLVVAVKEVLARAIEAGGTTLRDFVHEDGSPGYFRHDLKVYGRGGEPCVTCGGTLQEIRLGGRTTVFCTRCQR